VVNVGLEIFAPEPRAPRRAGCACALEPAAGGNAQLAGLLEKLGEKS
jgi:hypothetical protein